VSPNPKLGLATQTWPGNPQALSTQLRRAAALLRTVGIKIDRIKKGRARSRIIHITVTDPSTRPDYGEAHPSASSASQKIDININILSEDNLRTVGGIVDANTDDTGNGNDLIVHANPLRSHCADDNEWLAEDWQTYFSEGAAIIEFDGGISRPEAEVQALACCVTEWMKQHPIVSLSDHCLVCGGGKGTNDHLLPHGTAIPEDGWLCSNCWPDWLESRKIEAISAVMAMGIGQVQNLPDLQQVMD